MFDFLKEFKKEILIFIIAAKTTTLFFLFFSLYTEVKKNFSPHIELIALPKENKHIEKIRAFLDSKTYIYAEVKEEEIIEVLKKLNFYESVFFDRSYMPSIFKISTHFKDLENLQKTLEDSRLFLYLGYNNVKYEETIKLKSIIKKMNTYFSALVFLSLILCVIAIIIKPEALYNFLVSCFSGWSVPACIGAVKFGITFPIISLPIVFSITIFLWSLTYWEKKYL
ncbi:MAG: hypothetical protein RMJ17_04495 [Candidatus Aenigmarchaeota archaeon]|nr:hypothetical protein [Candidatus Aenigmarchaeota archaeon]MDW8149815.1 hypothetical protein [Candidatus Aenigmarchaeota archaeon]